MAEARILLALARSEPNFFGQSFLDLSMVGCIGSGWRGQVGKNICAETIPDTSRSDAEPNQDVCEQWASRNTTLKVGFESHYLLRPEQQTNFSAEIAMS